MEKNIKKKGLINKVRLCNTGNSIQYPVINHNGNEYKKSLHVYNWVTLLYNRDWHYIVNQLYFNLRKKDRESKLLLFTAQQANTSHFAVGPSPHPLQNSFHLLWQALYPRNNFSFRTSSSPWQPPPYFLSLQMWLLLISGILQCLSFCGRFISLKVYPQGASTW